MIHIFKFPDITYNWSNYLVDLMTETHIRVDDGYSICIIDIDSFTQCIHRLGYVSYEESLDYFKNLFFSNFNNDDYGNYIFIISFIGESKSLFNSLILFDFLKEIKIPSSKIKVFDGIDRKDSFDRIYDSQYQYEHFNLFFCKNPFLQKHGIVYDSEFVNYKNSNIDKYFLGLMRVIKNSRILIYNLMNRYDWFADKRIYDISFGTYLHTDLKIAISEDFNRLLTDNDFKSFPILFDGVITNRTQFNKIQDNNIRHFINLVVETSQTDYNFYESGPFITEKSIKPFYYYQLPLFISHKNSLPMLRNLNLDLFDDIFENHYYDNITDVFERIKAVLDILDNFIRNNKINSLNKLKKSLLPRLEHNFQIMKKINNEEYLITLQSKLKNLIKN